MPGISATCSSSVAKSARPLPSAVRPRYALTFWPSSVTSITPWSERSAISVSTSSNGRDTSSPRVYGTTQNVQYLLQPSMIDTNAEAPSTRGGGRWSNFSISGNEMSTCGRPLSRRARISAGRRCSVCGPKTTSTKGARRTIASPSWLATQPPTPMIRSGRSRFSSRTRPRSWNTRSCAFSRTEQVLNRMTSASSGRSVAERPSLSASTSAMRSESYSFIWHPKVRM